MNKDVFDGFNVNIFLDEDGDYLAHFVEMPNVSAFSDTPEGALRELAIAWKGVKESYQKHHEPVPQPPIRREDGMPFKVTIDPQLYHVLIDEATRAGVSLDTLVIQKLESTVPLVQEQTEG